MKFSRILVPFDFSTCSEAALKTAIDLGKRMKSTIHLVHVIDEKASPDTDLHSRERLRALLPPSHEIVLDVRHEVLRGVPHQAICDYAKYNKVNLIVMGTRARKGLALVALGSVAERVTRSAPCPVTIVREGAEFKSDVHSEAISVLTEQLGTQLPGNRDETFGILKKTLINQLGYTESESQVVLEGLESIGALKWYPTSDNTSENLVSNYGHWQFDAEIFQIVDEPDLSYSQFDFSDIPALDLIARAVSLRSTDIHIDPTKDQNYQIRFRIDGKLEHYCYLEEDIARRLIHQFFTSASLDLADPFCPREGRLRLPDSMAQIEARITAAPVAGGEAVAIRLFSKENVFLPLDHLGLAENSFNTVRRMLEGSEGLVLITGPTGSGKTTAVYSMLETIGGQNRNIVSIEDPVEFAVPFVRQISVDIGHGLTMTNGLRTILRMDPDVVFVGEIRDAEAAEIGMRAASSGRFVFSTLHTRDVASTITAFRDLGIQDRSLAGNLVGILNQRLVRRLCVRCRKAVSFQARHEDEFASCGLKVPAEIYEPVGCEACRGSGYRGRIGVFEAAQCTESIAMAITSGATESELRQAIRAQGFDSLTADAMVKVQKGIISFDDAVTLRWL